MKVKISMPGAALSVELEDEKAVKVFRALARELLFFGIGTSTKEKTEPAADEAAGPVEDTGSDEPEKEYPVKASVTEEDPEGLRYRGFMYTKCPKCGTINRFFQKQDKDHFHCRTCGARTVFMEPLVPMWAKCECGKTFKYMTNLEEQMIDVDCLECGAPVAVRWNERKKAYVTI